MEYFQLILLIQSQTIIVCIDDVPTIVGEVHTSHVIQCVLHCREVSEHIIASTDVLDYSYFVCHLSHIHCSFQELVFVIVVVIASFHIGGRG